MKQRLCTIAAIILFSTAATATAQPAEAPERHEVTAPPGFEVIADENGRKVLASAEDREWVLRALERAQPAAPPSTMPADVIERLLVKREWLEEQIVADLLIQDRAQVTQFIDQRLLPRLRTIESTPVPLFYLPTSQQTLKDLLRSGWSDRRFYLNRAADEVLIDARLDLNYDRPMDDVLIAAFYSPSDSPEQRERMLIEAMQQAESGLARQLSAHSQRRLQLELLQFIEQQLMEKREWSADQVWFRLGLVAVLSARYSASITGAAPIDMVAAMVIEPQQVLLRAANINLLEPADPKELRREYLPAYIDGMRRKSVAVVWDWLNESDSPRTVPEALQSIVEANPENGRELVSTIKLSSGVDLTDRLMPQ